jgi:hypothetical protein
VIYSTVLVILLGLAIIFPPIADVTTYESRIFERSAAFGVLDDNSTLSQYGFAFPPSLEFFWDPKYLSLGGPTGRFNLTLRVPFEITEDWAKINVSTTFSVGTYGGVLFFWSVEWRLYNATNTPLKGDWSHLLDISANSPLTLQKDLASNIGRDENNASIYLPGKWYYEGTLKVFNVTLEPLAGKYQIYYNLGVRVSEQISSPISYKTISMNSIYFIAATIVILVLVLTFRKFHRKRSS